MTSKSGGGPPLPSHLAFLPPGVSLSNFPPPVSRPLAPAPLHPQSDQVYPKTRAPEPIRIQICGQLGQQIAPIVSQLIEGEQRQPTLQFQQQMMFQQVSSQLQQTSQSEMNMMMMRMMMQRPLTVPYCTNEPCGSYGEFRDSCGISAPTSKTIFYWRGTLLLNLPIRYLESGDLRMNLSSTDRDGAKMDHDYYGQSVRSAYYKIQSHPTPPICFRIAGEYTLEVPYPELFVPPIIAGFMCSALVDNIHSPQNSDWGQVYTLMLKRLGTDLQAPTDRIKNSLENGRVVENQQRYIPNPQYYVPTKYLQGSQLEISAGEFTNFLTEQISKEAVVTPQLVQTCLELSKTLQCHPDLHNMCGCVSHQERGQDYRGQIAAGDPAS